MVVGDLSRWLAEAREIGIVDDIAYIAFCDLDQETLTKHAPAIILSPLIADTFDVLDIATRLSELRFAGRYRALSTGNSDAKLIKAEVLATAPDLDFDILEIK